jgi:CRISPR-associated endonuclease/helicase Cas3
MRSKPIDPSPSPLTGAPLAHVTPAPDVRPHLLIDHLNAVGRLAGEFAASFGSDQTAYLAGLWHDVGKYRPRFQQIIRAENGFEAHIEGEHSRARDHSTAGALLAQSRRDLDRNLVAALAFCIAGHHAGLADASDLKARLLRSKDLLEEARWLSPQATARRGLGRTRASPNSVSAPRSARTEVAPRDDFSGSRGSTGSAWF